MPLDGGEPRAITDMPRGAGVPNGRPTARRSRSRRTEPEDLAKPDDGETPETKPRESDVRVITEAVYRANGVSGSGFVDSDRPSQIWTVAVPAAGSDARRRAKRMTSGEFASGNHHWSHGRIADLLRRPIAGASRTTTPNDSDLYAVSQDGGEPTQVASIEGSIGAYALSPDGKRIAFVGTLDGNPSGRSASPISGSRTSPGGTPRNLTAGYDFDISGGVGGDQRAPRGSSPAGPIWSSATAQRSSSASASRATRTSKRVDVASRHRSSR